MLDEDIVEDKVDTEKLLTFLLASLDVVSVTGSRSRKPRSGLSPELSGTPPVVSTCVLLACPRNHSRILPIVGVRLKHKENKNVIKFELHCKNSFHEKYPEESHILAVFKSILTSIHKKASYSV